MTLYFWYVKRPPNPKMGIGPWSPRLSAQSPNDMIQKPQKGSISHVHTIKEDSLDPARSFLDQCVEQHPPPAEPVDNESR